MYIIGLDVGGANTKIALINFQDNKVVESYSSIEYFPFWEQSLKKIPSMIYNLTHNLLKNISDIKIDDINYFAISMTAELSDAFMSKKEGVNVILESIEKCYPNEKIRIISNQNKFLSLTQAYKNYKAISASNWVATALFLGNFIKNAILIDAGSTTIDIIPIKDKIPITQGKDDISRLIHHELVYTGGLRATIPSITHFVPYKNKMIRISFEKFALISDVHRILGNISEEEYINETADKRSADLEHCYARLARTLCLDLEMISKSDLDKICRFIYKKQLDIVKSEIQQFMNEIQSQEISLTENPLFIITGLSSNFLVKKALKELKYNNIQKFEDVTGFSDNISSSAFAVAGALYNSLG